MPEIEKDDIDRERKRLEEARRRLPALGLVLDHLPDNYDPELPLERRSDD